MTFPTSPRQGLRGLAIFLLLAHVLSFPNLMHTASPPMPGLFDLSLLVAAEYPVTWPEAWPFFQINHYLRIGPTSAYNSDILAIDINTGTQLDFPPHSVPRPDSNLPNAGPTGLLFSDKIPAWQFAGEACVIDVRDLRDSGKPGHSILFGKDRIVAWEKQHRPLRFGDVVLFYSGYSDRYYRPFPAGNRFAADPVNGTADGWPDPNPEAMDYIGSRGVKTAGTDSPSMGPIPGLAEPTHLAGLKHGMIWTEGLTGLSVLPPTGAFYCSMAPKHVDSYASEGRAFAIVGNPLAEQLIQSAGKKNAVDLSMSLSPDLPLTWPGAKAGEHRQPFTRVTFSFNPVNGSANFTHMFDSHAGTHLVPPSYSLPPPGFDDSEYAPEVQTWLREYEEKYGERGVSTVTVPDVPIGQTIGPARVVDVRSLVGTSKNRPGAPEITPDHIRQYEQRHGELKAGDIVVFHSGHSAKCSDPSAANSCMADPLQGRSEGWPAPGPEAVHYLAGKGIRCIAIDAPSMGGVQPKNALMTYWALGSKNMVAVEYLTNVDKLPEGAFFLFAAPKIRGTHGGPGRAIALY